MTNDLCQEIRKCIATGIASDSFSKAKTQGAVIPGIPQADKGIDVEIKVEDKENITEIVVYPIRTKDYGCMRVDLKNFMGLFESVAYMWTTVEQPVVELFGYYHGKTYRVQIHLVENLKGEKS